MQHLTPGGAPLSPYKGLFPYEEVDSAFFFGREGDTRLITANLYASPLTLLYGESGVGKSSILGAGVAHKLRGNSETLLVVFKHWEKDPLAGLKTAIEKVASPAVRPHKKQSFTPPKLSDSLALCLASWAEATERHMLIVLDQFEDFLQYHPRFTPFAEELSRAVMQANVPASFLIAIKEEALAKLDRFEGSIPILFDNYLRLEHLNRNAARDAIKKPIDTYNDLRKGKGKPYSIEEDLVSVVLENLKVNVGQVPVRRAQGKDLKSDSGKPQFDTVHLQLIMRRLWDEEKREGSHLLRRSTLDRLKGTQGILRDHLLKVMGALDPEEQACAAAVFKYLVRPSGTKVAYSVKDLVAQERVDPAVLKRMLEKLSEGENRILRAVSAPASSGGEMLYELFLDSLGPAVLDWRSGYIKQQDEIKIKERMEREQIEKTRRDREAIERLEKRNRRYRRVIMISFIVGAVIAILAFLAIWLAAAAKKAEREARMQKDEADRQRAKTEEALGIVKEQDQRVRFTKSVMRGHAGPVTDAAFSPDGSFVVTAGADNTARVWDTATGDEVRTLEGHNAPLTDISYSRNGRFVLTAGEDATARLWDAEGWKPRETAGGERVVTSVLPTVMTGHGGAVTSVSFSPDDGRIVTSSADGTACLWVTGSGECQVKLKGHEAKVFNAQISPDGSRVVTASEDGTARVWDAATGSQLARLIGHDDPVNTARFNGNGKRIVTAGQDGTARIWDTDSGQLLNILRGHAAEVHTAEFSPDGEHVVTSSADKTARLWRTGTGESLAVYNGHEESVNSAAFSGDGQKVLTASDDKTARVWSAFAQKQKTLAELSGGHAGKVTTSYFSSDGRLVLTASTDKTARVWDTDKFSRFSVAEARVDPINHYPGPCPATVTLRGRIDVSDGSGAILYRFVRTDGISSQQRTLDVPSPGTYYVSMHMGVSMFNTPINARYSLVVEEPNKIESEKVRLRVRCNPETTNSQSETKPGPTPEQTPPEQ